MIRSLIRQCTSGKHPGLGQSLEATTSALRTNLAYMFKKVRELDPDRDGEEVLDQAVRRQKAFEANKHNRDALWGDRAVALPEKREILRLL